MLCCGIMYSGLDNLVGAAEGHLRRQPYRLINYIMISQDFASSNLGLRPVLSLTVHNLALI